VSGDASVLPASVQGTDTVCCTFALNYVHLTAQVLVPALQTLRAPDGTGPGTGTQTLRAPDGTGPGTGTQTLRGS